MVKSHEIWLLSIVLAVWYKARTDQTSQHHKDSPVGQVPLILRPPIEEKPASDQRHEQANENDPDHVSPRDPRPAESLLFGVENT